MTLREREAVEQAFYLLIDGIDRAFFTRADAMASVTLTGRTKHVGLREPSYEYGIDIREGWYTQSTANLVIDDVDEVLANLFASSTLEEALTQNIQPNTTAVNPQVYGKHVGLECFGAAGERHRFPWHPNDTAGHEHVSEDSAVELGVAAAKVTSTPSLFAGRRFGLYRTLRKDDGTWLAHPPVAPVNGVEYAELRYWGCLRDSGTVRGRTWTLSVGGPESLLQRTLGQQVLRQPTRCNPVNAVAADERFVACGMQIYSAAAWFNDGVAKVIDDPTYGSLIWTLQTATAASGTVSALRTAINAAFADALDVNLGSTTPPATTQGYDDIATFAGSAAYMDSQNNVNLAGLTITYVSAFGGCRIVAHEKAWAALGYQPVSNGDAGAGEIDKNDTRYVAFQPFAPANVDGIAFGPGYFVGVFFGANPTAQTVQEVGVGGRTIKPYWENGAAIWPNDVTSTPCEFDLIDFGTTYAIGQHDRPPAEDPDNPSDAYQLNGTSPVSDTRLALISGTIRYAGTDQEEQFFQLARTSWTASQESVGAVGIYPRGVVSAWLRPDLYGIENRGMDRPWAVSTSGDAGSALTWVNSWSNAKDDYGSQINQLCQRVLLSTGTSLGWVVAQGSSTPAFGDSGAIDRGDYDPNLGTTKDAEIADLGLAIPRQLVADAQVWKDAAESVSPNLFNVVCATAGPIQADELLRGLTAGIGLCWNLRGGKYGLFDPWQPPSTTDFDAAIGQAQMLRVAGDGVTQQDLRALAPIDVVKCSVRERITSPGNYADTWEFRATDRGAKFRTTGAEHSVTLPWHQPRMNVRESLSTRWDLGFVWWSRRHFIARAVKVGRIPGQDLYPGSRVVVTDPWMISQAGDYGVMQQPALVLSVSVNHDAEVYTLDLLVYDAPEVGQRVMAPEARVVAYDAATFTLQCLPDFRGIGGSHHDLAAFVKPSWASGLTGDLTIQIRQGTRANPTEYGTLTGAISIIDLDANTVTLTGAISGTWRRDAIKLMTIRPFGDQVEWGRRVFYPIATETGQVGGSASNAVPLPE